MSSDLALAPGGSVSQRLIDESSPSPTNPILIGRGSLYQPDRYSALLGKRQEGGVLDDQAAPHTHGIAPIHSILSPRPVRILDSRK